MTDYTNKWRCARGNWQPVEVDKCAGCGLPKPPIEPSEKDKRAIEEMVRAWRPDSFQDTFDDWPLRNKRYGVAMLAKARELLAPAVDPTAKNWEAAYDKACRERDDARLEVERLKGELAEAKRLHAQRQYAGSLLAMNNREQIQHLSDLIEDAFYAGRFQEDDRDNSKDFRRAALCVLDHFGMLEPKDGTILDDPFNGLNRSESPAASQEVEVQESAQPPDPIFDRRSQIRRHDVAGSSQGELERDPVWALNNLACDVVAAAQAHDRARIAELEARIAAGPVPLTNAEFHNVQDAWCRIPDGGTPLLLMMVAEAQRKKGMA